MPLTKDQCDGFASLCNRKCVINDLCVYGIGRDQWLEEHQDEQHIRTAPYSCIWLN